MGKNQARRYNEQRCNNKKIEGIKHDTTYRTY